MLHLGADGRHLAADRDDVQRAIALALRGSAMVTRSTTSSLFSTTLSPL
jgi:hypothetical protein